MNQDAAPAPRSTPLPPATAANVATPASERPERRRWGLLPPFVPGGPAEPGPRPDDADMSTEASPHEPGAAPSEELNAEPWAAASPPTSEPAQPWEPETAGLPAHEPTSEPIDDTPEPWTHEQVEPETAPPWTAEAEPPDPRDAPDPWSSPEMPVYDPWLSHADDRGGEHFSWEPVGEAAAREPEPWADGLNAADEAALAGAESEDAAAGRPTGELPDSFFADAFFTPSTMQHDASAQDPEQVMAEQVAARLDDLSRQIRERGLSALAESLDPDQLSRILAAVMAGFVARDR